MPDPAAWRIDELAHRSGLTVDTIRFYQREGLLPAAARAGRNKLYGEEHLDRLARIRELQGRRFSLAAIRALLDAPQPGLAEGIFAGGDVSYSFEELRARSGIEPALARRLHESGLVRDPAEFGRDAYDAADLDVLRAVTELARAGLPDDVIIELGRIYTTGVEAMQAEVLELFTGTRGPAWDPDALHAFQTSTAAAASDLLPVVTRLVEYVHQRTLQRLTLRRIEQARTAHE